MQVSRCLPFVWVQTLENRLGTAHPEICLWLRKPEKIDSECLYDTNACSKYAVSIVGFGTCLYCVGMIQSSDYRIETE